MAEPLLTSQEAEERWHRAHGRFARAMLGGLRLAEIAPGESRSIEERFVQIIWSEQFLRAESLATSSGKHLEVLEPGRWNTGPGPDFLDARIRLAGTEITGDIEIHVDSADWARHGHHQDFAYNRVVLHAVLRGHDDRPYEDKQNGERLERVVLEHLLDPDLETLRRTINLDDYPWGRPTDTGLCHSEFTRLPAEQLAEFLSTAARVRIEDRIARYGAQLATASFDQLLYQALMVAQGYKSNKTLYFLLSKRVPVAELADLAADVPEAARPAFHLGVLLHVAQLIPAEDSPDWDDATRAFIAELRGHWRHARPYFADRLLPPTRRWFAGMRPPGFPTRRLTAVALLLGRMLDRKAPLFPAFCAAAEAVRTESLTPASWRKIWGELTAPIEVEAPTQYFATRFTFGGKAGKPLALLGEPAARTLVFNTLLPLAILRARRAGNERLERQAWTLLQRFPALEENSVTRFMRKRLLGDEGVHASLFRMEFFQQSLYKVFSDCCAHNERSCTDCTFLALGAGKAG